MHFERNAEGICQRIISILIILALCVLFSIMALLESALDWPSYTVSVWCIRRP